MHLLGHLDGTALKEPLASIHLCQAVEKTWQSSLLRMPSVQGFCISYFRSHPHPHPYLQGPLLSLPPTERPHEWCGLLLLFCLIPQFPQPHVPSKHTAQATAEHSTGCRGSTTQAAEGAQQGCTSSPADTYIHNERTWQCQPLGQSLQSMPHIPGHLVL